jgi:hypothetical protein
MISIKYKMYRVLPFVFLRLLCSCVSTKNSNPPQWVADISAVYPSDKYIAGHGYGQTRQSAENVGLSAISRYFEQHISINTTEQVTVSNEGKSTSIINNETFIKSQTELFAVHYSQPYLNTSSNEWEIVAYIDREEAWAIFNPKLEQKINSFEQFYFDADNEQDDFQKIISLSRANQFARENDLERMLNFANILYPQFVSFNSGIRDLLADIPSRIVRVKTLSTFYIECKNDVGNVLYTSISRALEGFTITQDENKALYICRVELIENTSELKAGIFYKPVITIMVTGKNGSAYLFSRELNRVGATDPDTAKRRLYSIVAVAIQETFLEGLH